jgi:hypothetical protein
LHPIPALTLPCSSVSGVVAGLVNNTHRFTQCKTLYSVLVELSRPGLPAVAAAAAAGRKQLSFAGLSGLPLQELCLRPLRTPENGSITAALHFGISATATHAQRQQRVALATTHLPGLGIASNQRNANSKLHAKRPSTENLLEARASAGGLKKRRSTSGTAISG